MIRYSELKQRIEIERGCLRITKYARQRKAHSMSPNVHFCTGVFKASYEKNCFKCFSCEARGNILDFVVKKEQVSIRDAALLLYAKFIEKPKPTLGSPQQLTPLQKGVFQNHHL